MSSYTSPDHLVSIDPREPTDYSTFFPQKIYKVHHSLRSVNENAYEPALLSVGPYHHGTKERYEDTEKYKNRHLQWLISRRNQKRVEITPISLEKEMQDMEQNIRACYGSSFREFDSEEFCKMMVLDGCFVIELLRRRNMYNQDDGSDPIFRIPSIMYQFNRDLFLLENQLPLFVLDKLFKLTNETPTFVQFALPRLHRQEYFNPSPRHFDRCPHLLGLSYMTGIKALPEMTSLDKNKLGSLVDIRSATELHAAGVVFKMSKAGFGAIKFSDNGVLEIPCLLIEDDTESLFRNYIAYEQYSEHGKLHRYTDFILFMDCLINTSKDAELLRHAKIISNGLGDDNSVAEMFNRLSLSVSYDSDNFYYAQQYHNVNQYCGKRRNVWMAKLRSNYFNSPWALLSFLAALTLLFLTIIQAVCSVLSYANPRS